MTQPVNKLTQEQFIARAVSVHGDRYDYTNTTYEGTNSFTTYRCPQHGEIRQRAMDHLRGRGCSPCNNASKKTNKLGQEEFLKRAKEAHGDRYDYSKAEYKDSKTPCLIICPEHGEFKQIPVHHWAGRGCKTCGSAKQGLAQRLSIEEFKSRAEKLHDNAYDYSNVVLSNGVSEKVLILCRVHGAFSQAASEHLAGKGCRKCSTLSTSQSQRLTQEEAIAKFKAVHGDFYDYSKVIYGMKTDKVTIICPDHGDFEQQPDNHWNGQDCPQCARAVVSKAEVRLQEYVNTLTRDVTFSNRAILDGKEIDILTENLGIEYNGLYWHSDLAGKPNNYHKEKTELAKSKGVKLIHIFEDEWLEKQHIVKARLAAKLGKSPRAYARKMQVKEITWKEARTFYESNHLQGAGQAGKSVGLYENDTLMACFTVGKRNNVHELLRYASIGTVVGGFSRLLKAFTQENPAITSLISYSDLRWGEGNVYGNNGFKRLEDTQLGYFWCKGNQRFSRQKFQKHKLAAILPKFDPEKTEVQNMHENGYFRIFDCGHAKWEWTRDA